MGKQKAKRSIFLKPREKKRQELELRSTWDRTEARGARQRHRSRLRGGLERREPLPTSAGGWSWAGREARTRLAPVAPCPQPCATATPTSQRARGTQGCPAAGTPPASSPFLLPGTSWTPAVPSGCGSGSRARRVPAFICQWGSVQHRHPRLKGASVRLGDGGEAAPELRLCFPESSEPALHALPSQEAAERGTGGEKLGETPGSAPRCFWGAPHPWM